MRSGDTYIFPWEPIPRRVMAAVWPELGCCAAEDMNGELGANQVSTNYRPRYAPWQTAGPAASDLDQEERGGDDRGEEGEGEGW